MDRFGGVDAGFFDGAENYSRGNGNPGLYVKEA